MIAARPTSGVRVGVVGIGRVPRRCAAASSAAEGSQSTHDSIQLTTRLAKSSAELRAAASVRAQAFYAYPEGRSEFAARAHHRMKADLEWDALEKKTRGQDKEWQDVEVTCMITTVPASSGDPLWSSTIKELDPSFKLPMETDAWEPPVVIGTLDLNRGESLPVEHLVGARPEGPGCGDRRGYLSNVCVATAARRRGVARDMVEKACKLAMERGVMDLYVHVLHDNETAVQLYLACGFVLEDEEDPAVAVQLQRPRRILMHKGL